MKTCTRCKQEKDPSHFVKAAAAPDGMHWWCRECTRAAYQERQARLAPWQVEAQRERRRVNAHRMRANDPVAQARRHMNKRLRSYDLTTAAFVAMWNAQEGKCDICLCPLDDSIRNVVDHDHATGKVRGLLCVCCNTVLGQARDDPAILGAAIEYLAKHST